MPRRLLAGLTLACGGAAILLTTGVLGPPLGPAPPAPAATCQASGAKHLSPPLSDAAACARFMAGIAAIPGLTSVQLKILPQGVLSAIVTRAGTSGAPSDYGLAVSDRAMTANDLDRLAANVVADLAQKVPR